MVLDVMEMYSISLSSSRRNGKGKFLYFTSWHINFVDCYTKSTTLRTNQTHCTYCAKTICPHTSSAVYSMELLSATKSTWGERDFMSFETAARSRLRVRLSQLGATVPRCTDVCLAKTSPTKFHINHGFSLV